jgi:hypothetical protein
MNVTRWSGGAVAFLTGLTLALGGCSGSTSGASSSSGAVGGDPVMNRDTTMEGTTRPGTMHGNGTMDRK